MNPPLVYVQVYVYVLRGGDARPTRGCAQAGARSLAADPWDRAGLESLGGSGSSSGRIGWHLSRGTYPGRICPGMEIGYDEA